MTYLTDFEKRYYDKRAILGRLFDESVILEGLFDKRGTLTEAL